MMRMRYVNWPTHGDRSTFRRRATLLFAAGATTIAGMLGVATALDASLLAPLAPLGVSLLLLHGLWVHGAARSTARRSEVERSFGGLVVRHHGAAFAVADREPLGEYATRRLAAHAALDRGGWAIIVQAWDRYYLLACEPARDATARSAVSFRSRAVADVVPAIRDDVALTA
jgi:hypothetical protein